MIHVATNDPPLLLPDILSGREYRQIKMGFDFVVRQVMQDYLLSEGLGEANIWIYVR